MPRPPSHNLGQRATWAEMAGYNLSRAPSIKSTTNGQFNPTRQNPQSSAYKWSAGGIGNQLPDNVTDDEALIKIAFFYRLRQLQEQRQSWQPLPIQIQPKPDEDTSWDTWMLRGGRGSGKTEGASRYVLNHLRKYGPKARVGVGGKTAADARDTCAEGESGLITLAPHEFYYHRSLGEARHVKGGYVKFMGAEQPARWNGPQWSLIWGDECGLWPKETFDQAQFGLRLGEYPRTIISTTPKVAKWLYELEQEPTTVHTTGKLYDNVYLSEFARNRLVRKYKGTSLEKRELEGEWSFQSENALWTEQLFRPVNDLPQLTRIVIAIDPAVTSGETSDDTGIVAAGIDSYDLSLANGYVLRDRTVHLSPFGWGETAIALYDELEADLIVAEVNNGGDLVEANLRAVCNSLGRAMVPFKKIHATRGKIVRAQPIVALYEQARVYHYRGSIQTLIDETINDDGLYVPTEYSNINLLTELENEMCSWDPESYKSPNRMDAAVWALTELLLKPPEPRERRLTYTPRVSISRY